MPRRKRRAAPVRLLSASRRSQPFPRGPGPPDRRSQSVRYHVQRGTTTKYNDRASIKSKYSIFA